MTKAEEIKALLAEVRERVEAASEAPWETTGVGYHLENQDTCMAEFDYEGGIEDAAFIAAARTDVPRLVAALEAAVVGLEEFTKPWPLDSNPGMTVKDAFDLFGRSLQHANEALAQVAKELKP